jgi:hypothetical protein
MSPAEALQVDKNFSYTDNPEKRNGNILTGWTSSCKISFILGSNLNPDTGYCDFFRFSSV